MRIENVTQHLTSRNASQLPLSGDRAFTKQHNSQTEQYDEKQIHVKDVKKAVNNLNTFIEPLQTNLKFQYHEDLNEYYVEVVNPMTEEVIREIPPKKLLDMYAAMADFMGILIDKKI
ncbi:MAG TPA: flagellar protein FlaG [Cerasibacillus sp.]|uniref:flagellar protein FlaG n=1 Tax=Cerasibacillus sp. TaxID=2498711 RepID=UPI002F40C99E